MQSCELAAFITTVACGMSKCYSKEELSVMAAAFNQLGDTLETIIASEEACSTDSDK